MIGGNVRVNLDVPPFFLYASFNVAPCGINLVGLKRAGFTPEEIKALKTAYRILYRSNLKLEEALQKIESDAPTPHTHHLINFIRSSKRGICRPSDSLTPVS
jgi:UDP-N-acetylglucosamine acyltransferase